MESEDLGKNQQMDFEKAIKNLEEIVNKLESGGLSLDQSLAKFTEGVKLVKFCNKRLDRAEKKIELVLKEDEEYSDTVPFEDIAAGSVEED